MVDDCACALACIVSIATMPMAMERDAHAGAQTPTTPKQDTIEPRTCDARERTASSVRIV